MATKALKSSKKKSYPSNNHGRNRVLKNQRAIQAHLTTPPTGPPAFRQEREFRPLPEVEKALSKEDFPQTKLE
jgi:hypothetical protein